MLWATNIRGQVSCKELEDVLRFVGSDTCGEVSCPGDWGDHGGRHLSGAQCLQPSELQVMAVCRVECLQGATPEASRACQLLSRRLQW